MKNYKVYYRYLLKNKPLYINVNANSENEAIAIASKKTLIYKKFLTLKEPTII